MQTMRCPRCEQDLPRESYTPGNWSRGRGRCRPCARSYSAEHYRANRETALERMRAYRMLKSFGITLAQYDQLLADQDGKCAICGKTEGWFHPGAGRNRLLAIDHCHETGRVRGLLCDNCNMGIGRFSHDPDLLRKAIEYLYTDD